jgi:Tol biopolymer transport system component
VRQEFVELPGPYIAWTPDSKWIADPVLTDQRVFALSLISVETGEKRKLTSPPSVSNGDTAPAFSPDGHTLAFTRDSVNDSRADLYLLRLASDYKPQGEPEKLALHNLYNIGAAWTPDGHEVVFSSGNGLSYGLWQMSPRNPAVPRRLPFAPDGASAPSISRQRNRLAYVVGRFDTNIWRATLPVSGGKPASPLQLISSTKLELYPSYSPDGTKIAFMSQRSGADEIWVCDADGSNPVQLTSSGGESFGPRWSPDGRTVVYTFVSGGKSGIYAVNANGGKPRPLITQPDQYQWPFWSRNGDWLYFTSIMYTGHYEISKMAARGGEPVLLTHSGGDHPEESPDGKLIYYSKGYPNNVSVWRVPAAGGQEVKVLDSVHTAGQWTVGQRGIYFFTKPDKQGHSEISIHEFATSKVRKLLTIGRPVVFAIAVSPDGQTILYTQVDEAGSDLMLVENFR